MACSVLNIFICSISSYFLYHTLGPVYIRKKHNLHSFLKPHYLAYVSGNSNPKHPFVLLYFHHFTLVLFSSLVLFNELTWKKQRKYIKLTPKRAHKQIGEGLFWIGIASWKGLIHQTFFSIGHRIAPSPKRQHD